MAVTAAAAPLDVDTAGQVWPVWMESYGAGRQGNFNPVGWEKLWNPSWNLVPVHCPSMDW